MADNVHEIKIVIGGDASGATGALSKVEKAFTGIFRSIGQLTRFLSRLNWAISAIQTIVEGYKKLTEWIHRASRAAAEMRMAEIFKDAANAMDLLISKQKTYNSLLQKELADLQRRNELDNIDRTDKEKREDEQRSIDRANEIAAAPDEKAEREIRRRWKVEDEQIARSRESDRLKREAANENEKAAIYGSKANAAQTAADKADSAAEDLRAEMIRMSPEQKAEAEKQIAALKAKAKALRESAEMLREEEKQAEARAALYEQQRDAIRNAKSVAEAENNAELAKEKREQEKKDNNPEDKKKRDQNLEDAQLARKKQEDLAALDPNDPNYARRKKEIEDTYEIKAAELKRDRATNDEDRQAADAEREAIGMRQERERREEEAERAADYSGKLADLADSSRPKDRLTAMGLGSGGTVDRTAQEQAQNVKTLVQLVKEEIAAIRANNNGNVAVYAP